MDPQELARRLEQGRTEIQEIPWYDYLIVNKDLHLALEQLRAVVTAARCRAPRVWPGLEALFKF
jgi:guanylate kinase